LLEGNVQRPTVVHDGFDELAMLDYCVQEKCQTIKDALDSLRIPGVSESDVMRHLDIARIGVEECKEKAAKLICKSAEDLTLQVELVKRCNDVIAETQGAILIINKRSHAGLEQGIEFDNGESIYIY